MAEKCRIHPLNDAERYNVFEGGELVQRNVLACSICISNTPWLKHRLVEKVVEQRNVPTNFVAESAKKFEG